MKAPIGRFAFRVLLPASSVPWLVPGGASPGPYEGRLR